MAAVKPQIPVGYAKAAQHGRLGPASWVNVFYFYIGETAHTPGEVIAAVAQATHDLYTDTFSADSLPDSWSISYVTVTYRDAEDSVVRVRVSDAYAGTNSAGYQDANVAYLVNWSTGDPRRGGKPRQYIPGVIDSVRADSAFLLNSWVTAIGTALVAWLVDLPTRALPLQLVEMSFRNDKTWRDAATSYPIIGGTLNPVVATQRRRVDRLRPS